jgi:hypothetical protein
MAASHSQEPAMDNDTSRKRKRINVTQCAEKLCCHPDTIKRRIRKPPAGFPTFTLIMGRYSCWEDEADAYVERLEEEARRRTQSHKP